MLKPENKAPRENTNKYLNNKPFISPMFTPSKNNQLLVFPNDSFNNQMAIRLKNTRIKLLTVNPTKGVRAKTTPTKNRS